MDSFDSWPLVEDYILFSWFIFPLSHFRDPSATTKKKSAGETRPLIAVTGGVVTNMR